jgi:hypothetical protein
MQRFFMSRPATRFDIADPLRTARGAALLAGLFFRVTLLVAVFTGIRAGADWLPVIVAWVPSAIMGLKVALTAARAFRAFNIYGDQP